MKRFLIVVAALVCVYWFFHSDTSSPRSESTSTYTGVESAQGEPQDKNAKADENTAEEPSVSRSSWGDGHQAGYDWAERNGITDQVACEEAGDHSNSPSFTEGCNAYVEEQR